MITRTKPFLLFILVTLLFIVSGSVAQAEDIEAPAGCIPAPGATAALNGYADRVIHEITGIELVLIKPGAFLMGNYTLGSNLLPPHNVTIEHPFYLGKTEVTNEQYRRFVEATGYDGTSDTDPAYHLYLKHWRGESLMSAEDDYPVVWVSWKNAQAFCQWAGLQLPSEAQWEYACRAGTTTDFYFGSEQKDYDEYGWALSNSKALTHPVGQKKPNPWGLYDMHGNVYEWTEDDYVSGYVNAPADGSARKADVMTKSIRGGSWSNAAHPSINGCPARFNGAPGNASNDLGFRVALPISH